MTDSIEVFALSRRSQPSREAAPALSLGGPEPAERSARGRATAAPHGSQPLRLPSLLDPQLAAAAAAARSERSGLARPQLTVPVAPSAELDDRLLFEAADDPGRKLYLPRYRLGEEVVSGERRYRVALRPEGEGWTLAVGLERYPAPEIEVAARDAEVIPHTVAVLLRFQLRLDGAEVGEKELAFEELTADERGLRAVLRLTRLEERDQVHQALTQTALGATLVVRRSLRVGVPLEPLEGGGYLTSVGRGMLVPGQPLDLDAAAGGEGAADVVLVESARGLRLVPQGGAQLADLGRADFADLGPQELARLRYADTPLELGGGGGEERPLLITSNWNPGGQRGIYNDHPTGVVFGREGWWIFNQDGQPLPAGAAFNVLAFDADGKRGFVHVSDAGNLSGNSTFLDHPALNGRHEALLLVTPARTLGREAARHIGVWYEGGRGRWAIYYQDRSPMPAGAAFHVLVVSGRRDAFVHRAGGANLSGNVTWIDSRLTDGNPDLLLFVTPSWNPPSGGRASRARPAAGRPDPAPPRRPVPVGPGVGVIPDRPVIGGGGPGVVLYRAGVYNDHAIGVYYWSNRWAIFNQDRQAMPEGAAFNVLVLRPGGDASLHRCEPANTKGSATRLEVAAGGGGPQAGACFAVRTAQGSRVKVAVMRPSGGGAAVQWMGYSDEPRYQEQEWGADLPSDRRPFVFPPDLYPYVFGGADGPPAGGGGLIRHTVRWQGATHVYYQDEARRSRFYYLPDAFKLARTAGAFRTPFLRVRFASADGSLEAMTAGLSYLALPHVDGARLEAAAQELAHRVPAAAGEPFLEPLLASRLRFRLGLPRADQASVSFVEQTEALVSLRDGIQHSLSLPLDHFLPVFDAMVGGVSLLFNGQVEIDLGEGATETIPPVPFVARMNDLAGEALDVAGAFVEAAGTFRATLRNAVESPVRVRGLAVELHRGGGRVAAAFAAGLPAELAPGETLELEAAATPPPGGGRVEAVFDLSQVDVLPEREAILDAVVDPTTRADYVRVIRVRTVRELFAPPADGAALTLILVELRRGDAPSVTVELRPDQLLVEARLTAPLRGYLLGGADPGNYSYRVTAVRGGTPASEPQWRTASEEDLWILSNHVA